MVWHSRQIEAKNPLFLYHPLVHLHLPTLAHPNFVRKTERGSLRTRWRRWIIELDNFSIISTLGIRDNTVLIFASDCGPEFRPPYRGIDAPWTGTYHTAMKGSLRAPFVTRWPGHVPFNVTSNKIVRVTDIFGTILGVTGTALPNGRPIDGIDQTSFFKDPSNSKPNRKGFLFYIKNDSRAIKWRDWKLHLFYSML